MPFSLSPARRACSAQGNLSIYNQAIRPRGEIDISPSHQQRYIREQVDLPSRYSRRLVKSREERSSHEGTYIREEYSINESWTMSLFNSFVPALIRSRIPRFNALRGVQEVVQHLQAPHSLEPQMNEESGIGQNGMTLAPVAVASRRGTRAIWDLTSNMANGESRPSQSGVNWRYASNGAQGLVTSGQEYLRHHESSYDSNFERFQYIQGTQGILHGLPENLSAEEVTMLSGAMPSALVAKLARQVGVEPQDRGYEERSWIHVVVYICLWATYRIFFWLAPLVASLLQWVTEWERDHHYVQEALIRLTRFLFGFNLLLSSMRETRCAKAITSFFGVIVDDALGGVREFSDRLAAGKLDRPLWEI